MARVERVLNYVCPKSVILYAEKPAEKPAERRTGKKAAKPTASGRPRDPGRRKRAAAAA
jgi:hypothetical protein